MVSFKGEACKAKMLVSYSARLSGISDKTNSLNPLRTHLNKCGERYCLITVYENKHKPINDVEYQMALKRMFVNRHRRNL